MKSFKIVAFTLFISSTLAFNGFAGNGVYWAVQKEKKDKERLVEKDKKKNDDNRGRDKKDEGGKKGKKP